MRHRTDEERREVVAAWRASGETAEAFCRRQGISKESLKRWKRRPGVGTGNPFLPVAVLRGPEVLESAPCQVTVGEHIRIECGFGTDEASLEKAIRAAVSACCRTSGR